MDDALVELIGSSEGAFMPYDDWVAAARAAKLRPEGIQNLKRRGKVHTRLTESGTVEIVRGAKPPPPPT